MHINELVREWGAALNARDSERLAALFVDDLVYEDLPLQLVCKSKDELKAFVDPWFAAVPDFAVTLDQVVAEGERAAARWSWSGTQKGPLSPDLPASGKHFATTGISWLEASDGRLRRVTDSWDLLIVLKQLGFA
jgi:steroid delta-isomerase-like uncharacterized protein